MADRSDTAEWASCLCAAASLHCCQWVTLPTQHQSPASWEQRHPVLPPQDQLSDLISLLKTWHLCSGALAPHPITTDADHCTTWLWILIGYSAGSHGPNSLMIPAWETRVTRSWLAMMSSFCSSTQAEICPQGPAHRSSLAVRQSGCHLYNVLLCCVKAFWNEACRPTCCWHWNQTIIK